MITDEEWKKLKSGDVIWYTYQLALKPEKLIITKITEILFIVTKQDLIRRIIYCIQV